MEIIKGNRSQGKYHKAAFIGKVTGGYLPETLENFLVAIQDREILGTDGRTGNLWRLWLVALIGGTIAPQGQRLSRQTDSTIRNTGQLKRAKSNLSPHRNRFDKGYRKSYTCPQSAIVMMKTLVSIMHRQQLPQPDSRRLFKTLCRR
jgi:hypothetical protein